MQATITSKGRITIPKPVRDELHLKSGDRVEFIANDSGEYQIVPVKASVKQLKGMLPKPKKAISLEVMDEAVARHPFFRKL